ncbi:vitamin B12 transporter BtuB [Flavobacteriaceae bacterium UJ101]|nr:vitamin B12 transporter BtuB [Flavobacteriaceae bacterium UJ101]
MKNKLGIVLIMMFSISWSQENVESKEDYTIDEVIYTSSKNVIREKENTSVVQTITQKDIEESGLRRLDDILREQTGLILTEDHGTGIQIQGIESDYILILLDGQPLIGRTAGVFDLSRITVNEIERIEVLKGPASALYGSEAMGGVVNIITKKPKYGLKNTLFYRLETNNTHDIFLNSSFRKDKFYVLGDANFFTTDGYDFAPDVVGQTVSKHHDQTYQLKAGYDFTDKTNLTLIGKFYQQDSENKTDSDGDILDYEGQVKEKNVGIKFNYGEINKLKLSVDLFYTSYDTNEDYFNETQQEVFDRTYLKQRFIQPEIRALYTFNPSNKITLGGGIRDEKIEATRYENSVSMDAQYFYGQYEKKWFDKLYSVVGFRFDHNENYASQWSPKLGLRYNFNKHFAIKGSVGKGFKAPDFRQLYLNFTNSTVGYTVLGYNEVVAGIQRLQDLGEINTIEPAYDDYLNEDELKSESSVGYNVEFQYRNNRIQSSLNFFRNDIEDLINTQVIATKTNNQNIFSYYNVNRSYTQGLEFNTSYKINRSFKIKGGYQFLMARDKDVEERIDNGEEFIRDTDTGEVRRATSSDYLGLINRSKHTFNVKLDYNSESLGLFANIRWMYRSKYGIGDQNGNGFWDVYDKNVTVDGYSLVNLTIGKDLFDAKIQLQGGIENVTDHQDVNLPNLYGRIFWTSLKFKL